MEKSRIGTLTAEGAIQTWPEVNISGQAYERGEGSTVSIGGGKFVVLPINYVDNGMLAELRKEHAPKPSIKSTKGTKESGAGNDLVTGK